MPTKKRARRVTRSFEVNRRYFTRRLQEAQVSLRSLARHMGLDPTELIRSLKGVRPFRAHELVLLCQHLQVPMDEVLKNAGIPVPKTIKYK